MSEQQDPQNHQWSRDREDWRAERWERREERRMNRHSGTPWAVGLILIVIGAALLLQNFNIYVPFLRNWWALFILLPAVGMLTNAWYAYQDEGGFSSRMRGSLIGGVFLCMLALALLFGISMTYLWPAMLILAGVGMLINGFMR